MEKYNLLIDWEDVTGDSGVYEEPVSISEAKDYLRLEGFVDDEDSPSSDFDDDDRFLSEMITSARHRLEMWTGLSFIPKTFEIECTNLAGNYKLPFGPVTSITSVTNTDDTSLDYTTTRNLSRLKTPLQENIIVTYEAGYTDLPKALKQAILMEVAYRYEHRGEEFDDKGICQAALNVAAPYKEVDTWLA